MQYYTFEHGNQSKDLGTIATPFGKFNHLWVLNTPPDYAQKVIENIFCDVEDADIYIDDFVLSPMPGMTIWHYYAPY
jgi:hypothetical protein